PNNYQHVGRRLADQLRMSESNGVLFADQWNNLDNAKAHYDSTGPEIWQQTGGKVDGFICSVGTGGTLDGVSRYLREKNKSIVIALTDSGNRYQSKLFNPQFMRSKNLPVPVWLEKRSDISVPFEKV